jgi:hypothetical protein
MLLTTTTITTDDENTGWHRGGQLTLEQCANQLSDAEKDRLKAQDGGLQTFIKNQHQVFVTRRGWVQIRNWTADEASKSKARLRSKCWFAINHPDGCPLHADVCSYIH